jgi:hypothetical protein
MEFDRETRDLDMRQDLQMALHDYLDASEPRRSVARDKDRLMFREFADGVPGKRLRT